MKTLSRPLLVFALVAAMVRTSCGDEVLLHSGPSVSTEVSSFASRDQVGEELHFLKQFFIASETVEKLPSLDLLHQAAPISAARAIELAAATVDLGDRKIFNVKRLELLVATATRRPVDYYIIEMLVNGSSEHRAVLMDGTVLKPRLTRVGK